MKHLSLLVLAVLSMTATLYTPQAAAEQATFKQQILPMNCLFQTIDVGTGTLKYLTPAACGVIIEQSPADGGSSAGGIIQPVYQYNATQTVFLDQLHKTGLVNPTIQLPWQPISSVQGDQTSQLSHQKSQGLSKTSIALLGGGFVLLLILVLVL